MNIYHFTLHLLLFLSVTILLKQIWYRFFYFLQMFQQLGYKFGEFRDWILHRFYSRVVLPEHFLFIVVVFSLLVLLSDRLTVTAASLILSTYILFWFNNSSRFRLKKEKKPIRFTARMKRLATTLGLITLLFLYVIFDLSLTGRLMNTPLVIRDPGNLLLLVDPYFLLFGVVLADITLPFLLFIAAALMKPVEWFIQRGFKRKAKVKLSGMTGLNVVAITGSYGKTSTKFLIRDLLKERYNVCATPGSFNTPMGICKVINNDLDHRHQILVLEMGARYKGDIQELCDIAPPDVAVITNVGKAHLETFGSVDAIAREKSVLAKSLKPGGTLILNADDPVVAAMASLNSRVEIFRTGMEQGTIRASEVRWNENGTQFTLLVDKEGAEPVSQKIEMQLLGLHNVQNFLLAAAVAIKYGLRVETIAVAARKIRPVEHRLELKERNGVTVIDDAFNSNPVGARHAVDLLASFKGGRRVIITPGMIELGELQEEENRAFGRHIADAGLDLVILVGREQTHPILDGIRQGGSDENVRVVNALHEANEILAAWIQKGDIVLYENDLPDSYDQTSGS